MLEATRTRSGRLDLYLLGLLLLVVLVAQVKWTYGVTSDGALYFAHLRSLIFDHDLQIDPEVQVLGLPPRPHHVIPIGPSIVWAPAYVIVAAVDWVGSAAGVWTRSTDVSLGLRGAYVQAALLSSFALAALGLVVLHLRVRREFGGGIAFLTSLLIVGATTLGWYLVVEPSMTHAAAFGIVALAIVWTERWVVERSPTRREAILLGVVYSLVILVRIEDGLFLLFPALALAFPGLSAVEGAPAERRIPVAARARVVVDMAIGAAPLLALQALMYAALLRSNTFLLVGGDEGYLLSSSRWTEVLFSSQHGLFSWTPLVWAGVIGTVFYVRRNPWWAVPALVVFVMMTWLNGSARDWSGGWAFGGRRFTSALAAFAPGFAMALDWGRRRPLVLLAPIIALAIGWNVLLMEQYDRGMIPRDEAFRFDTMIRNQAEVYVKPPYLYPFAFPANVWFAWRQGLPVDRYDQLGAEALRKEMYLPLNAWGARFLMGEWADGAGDPFGSRHYLNGPEGTILAPLDVPPGVDYALDIEARAEGGPAGRIATLGVLVNGRTFGELPLEAGAANPTRKVFVTPGGARIWRRGYNRVTLVRRDDSKGIPIVVYALRLGPLTAGTHQ